MKNLKNHNSEKCKHYQTAAVSSVGKPQGKCTSGQTSMQANSSVKTLLQSKADDPVSWLKGVRLVDTNPKGDRELAFVRKVKSRNFVVLEEVLYQGPADRSVRTYWAKSVREPDREQPTISAQAQIARHLRQFDIQGVWEPKHYLEIQRKSDESYKMILSEKLPAGKTLFQLIYDEGKTGLKEEKALSIIRKATKTVQALHGVGVYHWDISSKNIWVTDAGDPILFDWDFAFKSTEEFHERRLWRCGTPHYCSRERLDAMEKSYETTECTLSTHAFASHEAYSLISVLAHMLLGNEFLKYGTHFGIPFNEHELLGRVLKERNSDADGISPWLREILVQAFISGKSPFETAATFLSALNTNIN